MPDRLGDFLEHSVPRRHHLVCTKCGGAIDANTALAAQLSMKVHRKFKCPERDGKRIPMSIMENAQQLIASGETIATGAIGVNTTAAESLNDTSQKLTQVQDMIESTSETAAMLLGEGHAAVETVTGSAAVVTEKILELQGQVQALQANITGLDQLILAHSNSMKEAGQRAMGGGQ